MPIHSDKNLYAGMNPHLNSYLQVVPGYWESFHLTFIVKLAETIEQTMPPRYYTILCFDMQLYEMQEYDDEEFMAGIEISYNESPEAEDLPVLRIESLVPANKPGGIRHQRYLENRQTVLNKSLPLVEIDVVHQSPPIQLQLPSYAAGDTDAFPYMIVVTDPRAHEAQINMYGAYVDTPLPKVPIQLLGSDQMILDVNPAYHQACGSSRSYLNRIIDYEQLPLAFERYSTDDQERIRARMAVIANAS
jgi:hypothetical protein